MDRRRFLAHLAVAAPTLTVVGRWVYGDPANAAPLDDLPLIGDLGSGSIPGPSISDFYDLGDALAQASAPTMGPAFVTLEITEEGRAVFAVPRMEVGQGMTTFCAMIIAEELEISMDMVDVTLADARPELMFNQLTGGSYNARVLYQPLSRLAATAREAMRGAAAEQFGISPDRVENILGGFTNPDGEMIPYGSLTSLILVGQNPLSPDPKPPSEHTILGTRQPRIDAAGIVTGTTEYSNDLAIARELDALPTISVHPDTIRGTLASLDNLDELLAMPGVEHVATARTVPQHAAFDEPDPLDTSDNVILIGAQTFGHALEAASKVQATWNPGPIAGRDTESLWEELRANAIPTVAQPAVLGDALVEREIEWAPVGHAPMETMSAVADVRDGEAEVWSGLKIPIPAQQEISELLGLPLTAVTVHVVQSGGSFGRRLFHEAAVEAALASAAFGRPVNLQWSRSEETKHDRLRPPTVVQCRTTHAGGTPTSFETRYTGGYVSLSHGFGDALTSVGAHNPIANYPIGVSIFNLQMSAPYNLGATLQAVNEVNFSMNSGSWRSVYTGPGRTTEELVINDLAEVLGVDPYEFRMAHLKDDRTRRCLEWVATEGNWGRSMPAGTAQGIAANFEHRSHQACLVELDLNGPDGPRVTKAVMAADVGIPFSINGIENQMLGHLNDGISTILRAGIHIDNGAVRESSFGDFLYARQRHTPPDVTLQVFPALEGVEPGGFGEIGVVTAGAAVAHAYERATGEKQTRFPINF